VIGKQELRAVKRVMKSGCLSGYRGSWGANGEYFYGGPEIKALEKEWADYFETKQVIACNSATSGLWMALAAIGTKPDDEIIVTPWSMTCSASLPLLFGAKPVFADIEKDYYCLDPKSIEERITERTKAILVVDLFGMPYDADAINEIARKYNLYVIEDAAQAIGAIYKSPTLNRFPQYAGTLGDIGVFSLNCHKHIQTGEGGIVVTNDKELEFKMRLCMNHGEAVMNDIAKKCLFYEDYYKFVGMNLRMTELSAAIAREQLKKLPRIIEKYQKLAGYFNIPVRHGCTSAYYKFASLDMAENPNEKLFNMKDHYIDLIYQMPLFKQLGYEKGLCPVCEEVESKIRLAWLRRVL